MWELAGFVAVAAIAWFLWDSLTAREAANVELRETCRAQGLLFLDDTVALDRLRLARDGDGRMKLRRVYRFEYSDTGHDRRRGHVTLLGSTIERVDLGRPDLRVVTLQ
jgi:hypothetical protein